MRALDCSRAALVGACSVVALTLTGPSPAVGAPYTDDALLTISTTNPVIGGTLTITVVNFESGELIDIDLHSVVVRLATIQADAGGAASAVITLPANFRCEHHLTATGRTTGEGARTDLLIGPRSTCDHGGDPGSGNVGNGNTGHGNVGNGNSGNGNVGNGNSGNGNVGNGNHPYGQTRWGNVSYAQGTTTEPPSHASELALASIAGLAVVGGVGFLHRRRRRS